MNELKADVLWSLLSILCYLRPNKFKGTFYISRSLHKLKTLLVFKMKDGCSLMFAFGSFFF